MQKHVYFGKTNSYILNIGSDNICNMEAYGAFLTHNILLTQNQNHLYFRFKEVLFLFFFFGGGGVLVAVVYLFLFVCLFVFFTLVYLYLCWCVEKKRWVESLMILLIFGIISFFCGTHCIYHQQSQFPDNNIQPISILLALSVCL